MRPSHVAVLGPGGVGGLLGALMVQAGYRVTFLAGRETVQDLRDNGIRVRSREFGEFAVSAEADTELREPADACLVTVKQNALEAALTRVPAATVE